MTVAVRSCFRVFVLCVLLSEVWGHLQLARPLGNAPFLQTTNELRR
jgi:hypothetical protein